MRHHFYKLHDGRGFDRYRQHNGGDCTIGKSPPFLTGKQRDKAGDYGGGVRPRFYRLKIVAPCWIITAIMMITPMKTCCV